MCPRDVLLTAKTSNQCTIEETRWPIQYPASLVGIRDRAVDVVQTSFRPSYTVSSHPNRDINMFAQNLAQYWSGSQYTQERLDELLGEFSDFIEQRQKPGQLCNGENVHFVPREASEEHWSLQNIDDIIDALVHPVKASNNTIQSCYRIVLSILAQIAPKIDYRIDVITSFIQHGYDDTKLPFRHPPPELAGILDLHEENRFWDKFLAAQWTFCPTTLGRYQLDATVLDTRSILPITNSDRHHSVGRAIRIVSAHPESLLSEIQSREEQVYIALKTYPPRANKSYEREIGAFRYILNSQSSRQKRFSRHIVQHFGSFQWTDDNAETHHTLMMEVASFGTLRDMFKNNETPFEFDDIKAFWISMLGILKGLVAFHEGVYRKWTRGIHQDLKPDNILVCHGTPHGGQFNKTMKLADFDRSYIFNAELPKKPSVGGSRTYSPPDSFGDYDTSIDPNIHSDIWSVACIFIEAAVWLVAGESGRDRFRECRVAEIKEEGSKELQNDGLGECYHNGAHLLKCVERVPDMIDRVGRRSDSITKEVVEHLLNDVFQYTPEGRSNARILFNRLEYKISHARDPERRFSSDPEQGQYSRKGVLTPEKSTVSIFSTPPPKTKPDPDSCLESPEPFQNQTSSESLSPGFHDNERMRRSMDSLERTRVVPRSDRASIVSRSISTGSSRFSNMSNKVASTLTRGRSWRRPRSPLESGRPAPNWPEGELVTFNEAAKWRWQRKSTGMYRSDLPDLPGMINLNVLKNRDIWILVDNSPSMQKFQRKLFEHVAVLTYILKELDSDGLDLAFTSSPQETFPCESATDAQRHLEDYFYQENCFVKSAMENVCDRIIEKWQNYKMTRPKEASIFFLTDGRWKTKKDEPTGVEHVINRLIKEINRQNLKESHVTIHLVRYGDDELGKERLQHLDDKTGLNEITGEQVHDIVDHKPADGDLWEILIGPLDPRNDGKMAI